MKDIAEMVKAVFAVMLHAPNWASWTFLIDFARLASRSRSSSVKIRLALTFTQRLGMVYSSAPSGKLRERRTSAGRSGSHKCVNLFAVECKSGPFAQHFPPAGKETQPGGGFVAWGHDFRGFPTCTRVWRRGSPAGENSHQRKDRPLQLCAIHPRKGVESRRFFAELYFYRSELQFVGITARQ